MSTKPFTFQVQPPSVQPEKPPPILPPTCAVQVNDTTSDAGKHSYAYQNGIFTISDGVVPPPIGPIQIGSVVKTISSPTNVRPTPGGNPATPLSAGTQGTVVAGPQTANGFAWWQVKFPSVTGWVGFDSLQVIANPPIPQS